MNKILAIVNEGGKDIVKAVTVVGHACSDVEHLLTDGKVLAPEVKTVLTLMVEDGEKVATALTLAGVQEGKNWASDVSAVAAVELFVKDFTASLPIIKKAASLIVTDCK